MPTIVISFHVILNILGRWPFSSAGFQGVLCNINCGIYIQYLKSSEVNL